MVKVYHVLNVTSNQYSAIKTKEKQEKGKSMSKYIQYFSLLSLVRKEPS